MKKIVLSIIALFCTLTSFAQGQNGWIAVPGSSASGYGVYYFRKDIKLAAVPAGEEFRIWVSGDNHYKLYVNGKTVSIGPARSDIKHWNCEEVDLAQYLRAGDNTVAAVVWNEGPNHAQASPTFRTGFYIKAIDKAASELNTNSSWKCTQDFSYSPASVQAPGWYIAGPAERIDMHKHLTGWTGDAQGVRMGRRAVPATEWSDAVVVNKPNFIGQSGIDGTYTGWMMKKSELPQRELKLERLADVREAENIKASKDFVLGNAPITVPANTKAQIILDNKVLTNAYVTMNFSGGENSKIWLGYAEGLYESLDPDRLENGSPVKGNRDEIKGKVFAGRSDTIISNGGKDQSFTSLYWRTYRYIVLNVTTANEPITISDLYGTYTGFPFELKAKLFSGNKNRNLQDTELQKLFDVGWRTARLCAVETYMDCPYYEQMQYFGDARIQALVSLFMTGDDRLVKQLINAADWSRSPEGVTQSRFPSSAEQWIQTYALSYICTLHDYMMYGKDTDFLKGKLMAERTILDYFHHYQTADGRLKSLPGWNFTDWVFNNPGWKDGTAIPGVDGCNAVLDLQLLNAYQMAADMEQKIGMPAYAQIYNERAEQLRKTIREKYWHEDLGLVSDNVASNEKGLHFSQHANSFAILTGVVAGDEAKGVAKKLETGSAGDVGVASSSLAPASIYFLFYVHEALRKAGLGNDYLSQLSIWKEYLKLGMSTWGEDSNVRSTRSDCHAWGASPNIELFHTVLGIASESPGFKKVVITPHLCGLKQIGGTMPTPNGNITVKYELNGTKFSATIVLPESVTGRFVWKDKEHLLHGGSNTIND